MIFSDHRGRKNNSKMITETFLITTLAPNLCQRFNLNLDDVTEEIKKTLLTWNDPSHNLTVKQLRTIADEKGIKIPIRTKKDDIKVLINTTETDDRKFAVNFTVKQLREIAEEKNIRVPARIKKDDLVKLIRSASSAPPVPVDLKPPGIKVKPAAPKKRRWPVGAEIKTCGYTWTIGKKLAVGGFGSVYEISRACPLDDDQFVVKLEKATSKTLITEQTIYKKLQELDDDDNDPMMVAGGVIEGYNYIILQKLEYTLGKASKKLITNPATINKLVEDVLSNINKLHTIGYCHLDIKPENIMYSRSLDKWCLIDMGLCKKNDGNGKTKLVGTIDFMSREIHAGRYSEKSDIESFLYTVADVIGVKLPWLEVCPSDPAADPSADQAFCDTLYKSKQAFVENINKEFEKFSHVMGVKNLITAISQN